VLTTKNGRMATSIASRLDRALARVCVNCPVCRRVRRTQKGAAFEMVRRVESRVCPFCRAYERVYGRKAHEPLTVSQTAGDRSDLE
jgi:hypothetical protein